MKNDDDTIRSLMEILEHIAQHSQEPLKNIPKLTVRETLIGSRLLNNTISVIDNTYPLEHRIRSFLERSKNTDNWVRKALKEGDEQASNILQTPYAFFIS